MGVRTSLCALALITSVTLGAAAQRAASGRVQFDTVHARSLENDKYGDSPDREVLVYLPPSYDSSGTRRYPVLYLLHGFGASDRSWLSGYKGFSIGPAMDSLVAAGAVREMIVVMPSARTRLGGSFYVNSESEGDWEDFITRELVSYVDGRYRTLARPESRGLAGHSMGGYGTLAVGMRHAGDEYGALYAMSACCTHFSGEPGPDEIPAWETLLHLGSPSDVASLSFYPQVFLALSAAISPNPNRAPLYVDFPFELKDGRLQAVPAVQDEWAEHAPYDMLPRYADRLKRLRGLAIDIGTHDQLVAPASIAALDSALTRAGVAHTYETYEGTHTSAIGQRMTMRVLPFFSRTLDFTGDRR
ncbi:MAG: alpha/beta hydrolase [Gemmatimonadales bacterium]